MTDEVTNALIAGIRSSIHESMTEQRTALQRESARGATAAEKVMEAAAKRLEQKVEKRIAELSGTKSRGPAVIAILGVLFVVLLSYAVGWAMGHAGVSVSALLGI